MKQTFALFGLVGFAPQLAFRKGRNCEHTFFLACYRGGGYLACDLGKLASSFLSSVMHQFTCHQGP